MLETFRNAWKIEDLRKRLLFTLLILVLFRLGCALPVPYISAGALTSMFAGGNGDMLELSLIHISEPTRLGMISYAVFCLKKKTHKREINE